MLAAGNETGRFSVFDTAISGDIVARLCSLSRSRTFVGTRTVSWLISAGAATLPNVAGDFALLLLADLLLLVLLLLLLFAAQSNLAFLGMWITSNRPDQAKFLPFDADAGSSSNMASSQPGRPNRLQSWSGEIKKYPLIQEGFWN